MNSFTRAQIIHIIVGVVSFLTWIGLLIASRFVSDGAGFLTTFGDVLLLAKSTTIGAVAIATAVGNFTPELQSVETTTDTKTIGDLSVSTSVTKQGGFARLGTLITLATLTFALFGCAGIIGSNATPQSAQTSYLQACTAYGAAFNMALKAREAGKLNGLQIAQIDMVVQQITPICTGPLPANPQAATEQVTRAIANLAITNSVK